MNYACLGLSLAQWLWRRKFLNVVCLFSLFHYYLSYEKVYTGTFFTEKRNWISCTQGCFVLGVLLKLAKWFKKKKLKIWGVHKLMDRHMVGKQVIKEAPLSFQPKKVNKNPCPLLQIFKSTNIISMVPRLNMCLPQEDQAQAMPLRMENCSH